MEQNLKTDQFTNLTINDHSWVPVTRFEIFETGILNDNDRIILTMRSDKKPLKLMSVIYLN